MVEGVQLASGLTGPVSLKLENPRCRLTEPSHPNESFSPVFSGCWSVVFLAQLLVILEVHHRVVKLDDCRPGTDSPSRFRICKLLVAESSFHAAYCSDCGLSGQLCELDDGMLPSEANNYGALPADIPV